MTYEYICKGKCKKVQEKKHSMNEKPVFTCCGVEMKRYFGSAPLGVHGANTGGRTGT